jgi:uncharacterized membrane protein
MGTNPYQGQNPDQSNQYGGYTGYTPSSPKDDPYGAFSQEPGTGTPGTQSSGADYQYGQYGQQQQSSGAYQAPSSATRTTSFTTQAERKNAALSYVLGFLTGLFFFFKDRKSAFVRFHAAQSIAFSVPVFVVYLVLRLLTGVGFINLLLGPIIGFLTSVVLIGGLIVWAFLIFQAYRGGNFKLPYFGDYAQRLIDRFSK